MHLVSTVASSGSSVVQRARQSLPAVVAGVLLCGVLVTFAVAPGGNDDSASPQNVPFAWFTNQTTTADALNTAAEHSVVLVPDDELRMKIQDAMATDETIVRPDGSLPPQVAVVVVSDENRETLRAAFLESDALLSESGGSTYVYDLSN